MLLYLLFAVVEPLAPGLELMELTLAPKVGIADSKVIVVRIDPKIAKLKLLSANTLGEKAKTAGAWAKQHGLSVVINASMFQPGGASTGYLRAAKKQNGVANKDKAVFAFGPALAHIFDQQCEAFTFGAADNAVQNIRMLGCKGENMWAKSAKQWSTACVGEDQDGHILFIHVRSPLDVHDLIDRLKALPLGLVRLMYVEGGPEATLYLDAGGKQLVRVGSYETGFNENDDNNAQWDLPNVIGVLR